MAGHARPTLRCLREDLGQAVPPADTPLDEVPHPLLANVAVRIIGSVPRRLVAIILSLVPGCQLDAWMSDYAMPERPVAPEEQVWSNMMDPPLQPRSSWTKIAEQTRPPGSKATAGRGPMGHPLAVTANPLSGESNRCAPSLLCNREPRLRRLHQTQRTADRYRLRGGRGSGAERPYLGPAHRGHPTAAGASAVTRTPMRSSFRPPGRR